MSAWQPGVIGSRFLFEVLNRFGLQDVALRIILQESYPGWGYMIKEGATSLWERWGKLTGWGMNFHNYSMFSSLNGWFYKTLAGLQPLEPGWKVFEVKPFAALEKVRCSLLTIYGKIEVNWNKSDSEFTLELQVSVNTRARLYFPVLWSDYLIEESNLLLWKENRLVASEPGIAITLAEPNNSPIFRVDSGKYRLVMKRLQSI